MNPEADPDRRGALKAADSSGYSGRRRSMQSIIAGRKPVLEALRAGRKIEQLVFLTGVQGKVIEEIRLLAEQRGIRIVQSDKQRLLGLADDANTQGVVAIVAARSTSLLRDLLALPRQRGVAGLLLILDEIEDPRNLGALVRTAECAGMHGVILPRHHAAGVTPAVVKASAGATEHMPIAEVSNVVQTIEELKKEGYWIFGLDSAGDRIYTELDYDGPVAIVVGNEGKGIRRLVKQHCDYLVSIPLLGRLHSLNASVAGALVMYEAAKKRGWQRVPPHT